MEIKRLSTVAALAAAVALGVAAPASAASRHAAPRHGVHARIAAKGYGGSVRFAARGTAGHTGYQALVSDGPGSGFGFHHLPWPMHVAAVRQRQRQADATHQAIFDDALTYGGYYGFYGDSNAAQGNRATYGVYSGGDAYGSPFFAGYYGPGDGADYGPFGRAYD